MTKTFVSMGKVRQKSARSTINLKLSVEGYIKITGKCRDTD